MPQAQPQFLNTLPHFQYFGEDALLICDLKLLKLIPDLQNWAAGFSAKYFVEAGEELKNLHQFPSHFEKILKVSQNLNPRNMVIVAMGGGSVGDFAGFLASVFKRGVRLIHIPTTWLAALDSSHGGKTALNVRHGKNQVGTFYPAEQTLLVKKILISQPASRAQEAAGELIKIALLSEDKWVSRFEKTLSITPEVLWKYLPPAIHEKLKIVAQDPFEKTNIRQTLNLGHTLGHVLETALKIPHGTAVAHGLKFSVHWSFKRRIMQQPAFTRAMNLIEKKTADPATLLSLRPSSQRFRSLLIHDKKKQAQDQFNFIFIRDFGKPLCALVTLDELLTEAHQQGFIKK
jgi:3-dehydroquinate synthase